jgi:hypothetical protein
MYQRGLSIVIVVSQRKPRPVNPVPVAGGDRGDHEAEDHRQGREARLGRGEALDDLHVERDREHRAEHPEADEHAEHRGRREHTGAEELQRDDRVVLHHRLDDDERDEADDSGRVAGDRADRGPPPVTALLGHQEQRDERDDDRGGAEPVDPDPVGAELGQVQEAEHHSEGDDPDRHVDEEDPAPAGDEEDLRCAGEQAADQRAEHGRHPEHREEVPLVLRPLARGEHVAHDRERQGHEPAGADPLERAEAGEHEHRGRERRHQAADDEHRDREDVERPAPEDVGELPVDRGRDRRGDEVGGGDPRLLAQPVQVVADRADRGAHDRLVERREEHPGHEAVDDEQDLAVRHHRAVRALGSGGGDS